MLSLHELPSTQRFNYYDPDAAGDKMEFRLIYQGPLAAERCEDRGQGPVGRADKKHELRQHFHPQLRELWRRQPDLRLQSETRFIIQTTPPNMRSHPGPNVREINPLLPLEVYEASGAPYPADAKTWVDHIADDHQRCGGRFVPLIREIGGYTCSLDILFLRRDDPGNLVTSGGDIDNRIKVLFDGLRMPKTVAELGGYTIDPVNENPFFCLLEDDKLITSVTVTTDRLIVPQKIKEDVNDVILIIHVTMVNPSAIFAGNRLV
jgi:hypothetical protein